MTRGALRRAHRRRRARKCPLLRLDAEALQGAEESLHEVAKTQWSRTYVNDLPDGAFLYVEAGGEKDDQGKTVPRSLRHFPVRNHVGEPDVPHLRNARARIPQSTAPGREEGPRWRLNAGTRRVTYRVNLRQMEQDALRKLYDDAETVDAHLRQVKSGNIGLLPELSDAAEDYLLTSREILLRWASSQRHRVRLAASMRTLESHMRADDRTGGWVTTAVRLKERVEEDYRDYSRALKALDTLLASFPLARGKMLPQMDSALLTDSQFVASVRRQVIASAAHAREEIDHMRQLRLHR